MFLETMYAHFQVVFVYLSYQPIDLLLIENSAKVAEYAI